MLVVATDRMLCDGLSTHLGQRAWREINEKKNAKATCTSNREDWDINEEVMVCRGREKELATENILH